MKNIHIRRLYYRIRHHYLTPNNIVVFVALLIAASWAWGSVQAMERNYALQKDVDYKRRELRLAQLETLKLQYEQNYFKSDEYKELAVREKLGLVSPGEKVLILPPNTVSTDEQTIVSVSAPKPVPESNLQQWVNFLFGGARTRLQK